MSQRNFNVFTAKEGVIVKANMHKRIEAEFIFPDEIGKYSRAGDPGIRLAHKLIPIIEKSKTTLILSIK